MANFPGSIPSFAGFTSSHTLAAANHAAQHNLEQGEIVALATKLGTGSSTPAASTVLRSSSNGTSAWGQVALTTDVSGTLPVANGGTGQSSLTGLPITNGNFTTPTITNPTVSTGSFSSPTLVTPTIASFINAVHDHESNAGGGVLDAALALLTGSITHGLLGDDSSWVFDTWTPSIDASVTDPTFGSGAVQEGRYLKIGKLYLCYAQVKFGTSGTNAGSGNYYLTLPATPNTADYSVGATPHGVGRMFDSSTGFSGVVFPELDTVPSPPGLQLVYYPGIGGTASAAGMSHTAPWAWAASDTVFNGWFWFEAT